MQSRASDLEPLRNALFIMSDQLRWDHLACNGHPTLKTPSLDALAAGGVRFDRAYVQAGVCGPSRISFYTGRYVTSHGVNWNRVPLSPRELTLGDYLQAAGRGIALVGKTHVVADLDGLARLGVDPRSPRGTLLCEGGFEVVDRTEDRPAPDGPYARYLRDHGYAGADPWADHVIAADGPDGAAASGWFLRNAHLPAKVREEHSETAYVTEVALDYIRAQGERPWALHLSYVKPHWPYLAPDPYHARYTAGDMLPIHKSARELADPHPVYAAYLKHEESENFAQDHIARHVRPTYMGLVEQMDHHVGRVLRELQRLGRDRDTLVIFASDHGDYGGDHWLGEKDLFHEAIVRIPLIVRDPRSAADATRGKSSEALVEAIDVLPTMLGALAIDPPEQFLEGRSLLPLVFAESGAGARDVVVSEIDYSFRKARRLLDRKPDECRGWMVRGARWKYVHWRGFRPQLFDLDADPGEFADLGADSRCAAERSAMHARLLEWFAARRQRVTLADQGVEERTDRAKAHGLYYGTW
jgi:arylsulfatase A-like enzyme